MSCPYCGSETSKRYEATGVCVDERNCRIDQISRELKKNEETLYARMLEWRGLDPQAEPCKDCRGSGVYLYPSTAAWAGGAGGMQPIPGVCKRCWGSGNPEKPGANLRALLSQSQELDLLKTQLKTLTECLQAIATYEPREFAYDEWAYNRLVESYREAAQNGLQAARIRSEKPAASDHVVAAVDNPKAS